jgi:hypothetical protein
MYKIQKETLGTDTINFYVKTYLRKKFCKILWLVVYGIKYFREKREKAAGEPSG